MNEETGWALSAEPLIPVETLRAHWRAAFDAADSALRCAAGYLPPDEVRDEAHRLEAEREPTTALLRALASDRHAHVQIAPLTGSSWNARQLLGIPGGVTALVLTLDGVLIGSAEIHAAAWKETFDEFIARRIDRTHGLFSPFSRRVDYPEHMHAKPRLEGVRAFLASRGISLTEGDSADPPGAETVHGLANRKNQALLRRLDEQGVNAFAGSRRYLEIAHDAGVQCAVVSASANTGTILARSGLVGLVDRSVDGETIAAEGLRAKPAPDTLLEACRQLGVEPEHAAAFETTPAGIAAARAAGFGFVIGVSSTGQAAALRAEAPDLVVTGLAELLDRRHAA
jgi:HAD superfamily hydrolase (TIGR01509 family)